MPSMFCTGIVWTQVSMVLRRPPCMILSTLEPPPIRWLPPPPRPPLPSCPQESASFCCLLKTYRRRLSSARSTRKSLSMNSTGRCLRERYACGRRCRRASIAMLSSKLNWIIVRSSSNHVFLAFASTRQRVYSGRGVNSVGMCQPNIPPLLRAPALFRTPAVFRAPTVMGGNRVTIESSRRAKRFHRHCRKQWHY